MRAFIGRFRFPIAVGLTSLALVVALVGIGGLLVPNALAGIPWRGGPPFGGHWGGPPWAHGADFALPPALEGLRDVPSAERFNHFVGAQISLTDKDNQPLTITVTPGTVTAASTTELTIAANDGTAKTFTLNDATILRGKRVQGDDQATPPALTTDDQVVVVTLNNSTTATAVIAVGPDGFGPHGRGPFGAGR